jgi:HAMP domain-containing protein
MLGSSLGWTLLAERPLADFSFTQNALHRRAWLISALGFTISLLLFGWTLVVTVRPLRRLADAGDRLADGDLKTPIAPARADEIGSIATCLEVCRQTTMHGIGRLAGATRLRGPGTDFTMVIDKVADVPAARTGKSGHRPKAGT